MLAGSPCGYVCSQAVGSSLVVAQGPGVLRGVGLSLAHDLGAQLLYVQLIDSASPVTGGGAITPIAIVEIDHKNNTTERYDFVLPIGGVAFSKGCVVQVSSTPYVGTLVASAGTFSAFR